MLTRHERAPWVYPPPLCFDNNAHQINALAFSLELLSTRVTVPPPLCLPCCFDSALDYDLPLYSVDMMIHNRCQPNETNTPLCTHLLLKPPIHPPPPQTSARSAACTQA